MSVEINDHAGGCQDEAEDEMPCCEDTTEELRIEHVQKTTFDLDLAFSTGLIEQVAFTLIDVDPSELDYPFADLHAPPLTARDIPILVQSFLIW